MPSRTREGEEERPSTPRSHVVLANNAFLEFALTKGAEGKRSILRKARIQLLNRVEGVDLDDDKIDWSAPQIQAHDTRLEASDKGNKSSWNSSQRFLFELWAWVAEFERHPHVETLIKLRHPHSEDIKQIATAALAHAVPILDTAARYAILGTAYIKIINMVEAREINEGLFDWNVGRLALLMKARIDAFDRLLGSWDCAHHLGLPYEERSRLRKEFFGAEQQLREQSPYKDLPKDYSVYHLFHQTPPLANALRERGFEDRQGDIRKLDDALDLYHAEKKQDMRCSKYECMRKTKGGGHLLCKACSQKK